MAPARSPDVEAQAWPQEPPVSAAAECEGASSSATDSSVPGKQQGRPGAILGLLTPAQWLYCAFALLAELVLVWLSQQGVTAAPADDGWVCTVAHLMLVCLYPRAAPPGGASRSGVARLAVAPEAAPAGQQVPGVGAAAGPAGGGKGRLFFLDGVKTLCTQLVLVHHISIAFGGVGGIEWALRLGQCPGNTFGSLVTIWLLIPDQSFFMCLLFFVGGIFVPSSLERKGTGEFVRDKLKRLGWPLVVTYFVVSPLSSGLRGTVLRGGGMLSYVWFEPGVTWFLMTLLILSISYALVPFPQVALPMPSAAGVISTCAALGAVQGWISYCRFALLEVGPLPCGGLPFDVAFFAAGCVARRSGWMEGLQSMAPRDYWLARLAALVSVVGTGVLAATVGLAEMMAPRPGPQVCSGVWLGIMTGGISVSVLHFFAVHCNSSSRLQKMAGESQYAVYVLQVIVIPGVILTLLPILRAAGYTVEFESTSDGTFVSRNELPQWVIVGGWIYTVVWVTVISWPLGYLFRKLPFVRDVL
mmetsp:Transcript_101775/g.265446  ORF Transcript_101775/g.265446 Transcript_101775/m.265446 type:complete len:528 (+) Transcript_101775:33-1616(+)